ncbi:SesB [Pochonia chlamydosporia 170]|uniref:SesB n=1 Tax=Pochonia chlamydosporia 170 TaxID=1380566 RepID=A0A179G0M6_METCM|nr:SesB [Pochonia chlamydosporia 170]OAQ71444.1 SesB [Pochonia chlamydosporia 170]
MWKERSWRLPWSRHNSASGFNIPDEPFPDGVEILHDCHDANVDICFVHGLSGNRIGTWTAKGHTAPWPETLLPLKLQKARILTYGYDAYIAQKSVASTNGLSDHAKNLLTDLTANRAESNATSRPLIFVAHSLGGLVCKEAVLLSRNNPEPHLQSIFDCIKGIIFMGTPHQGSWMARWGKIPASALGVVKSTNISLLKTLQTDDNYLQSVQDRFLSMIREQQRAGREFDITCFFEELPLTGFRQVVSKKSATLGGYNPISVHGNHSNMVKFGSQDDNGFKRVYGELQRWELEIVQSAIREPSASVKGAEVESPAGSSFNNYGSGDMLNAPGGSVTKNNFDGASFRESVTFGCGST